ncbi:MAG TPA: SpoIIE family protein phosphatase [Gaiellaceae bacterium]|jgi:serine phosphatase RsbU (regulator of sigma subunit)
MVLEAGQSEERAAVRAAALDALAEAGLAAARAGSLQEALTFVAGGAREAAAADVVLVRVLEPGSGDLSARVVAATPALAAELEGSVLAAGELPEEAVWEPGSAPASLGRTAARVRARGVALVPVRLDTRPVASLELLRKRALDPHEERFVLVAAGQVALAVRSFGLGGAGGHALPALEVAGHALAAGADASRTAVEVVRLATEVVDGSAALLWETVDGNGTLDLAAARGLDNPALEVAALREAAARAASEPGPPVVDRAAGFPADMPVAVTLSLGRPPVAVLQLLVPEGAVPGESELLALETFGLRAARAIGAGAEARRLADELERARAVLAVVGRATAKLSLTHTLETAVEQIGELLGPARVGVYLFEDGHLVEAAGLGLGGPHLRVAERLLELAQGELRGRGVIALDRSDPLLASVAADALAAEIPAALATPLVADEETTGLLAAYPPGSRIASESDRELLVALAGRLAGAVQNARLHEQATQLSAQREQALAEAQATTRVLNAQYEISRSFVQNLSLDETLEAVARNVVDVLDVDVAVIRLPDERRELLQPLAVSVSDPNLNEAARTILLRPWAFGSGPVQRLFRGGPPLRLDERVATTVGATLMAPFLARGWTAVVVPVATPGGEVIATMTLISVRPGDPIGDGTVEVARAIAGQAALVIDNARLYAQQKRFADTMQRSLLPRSLPTVPGLEVGQVYESSSQVDVGGDVFDFLELSGDRLAVVLGDVTGHGIDATADMAMAKYVFRLLGREHESPGALLAAANDVAVDELPPGKFVSMVVVVVDASAGEVSCAAAGHPHPRLLFPGGSVRGLDAGGIVLGVDPGQRYDELRERLPHGGAVVLYTDGVVEARRDGELYGVERLDALLSRSGYLPAQTLAEAIVADSRSFAGGDLLDDAAVVVIRRV